jgi:L-ascorbate metabolism protein UlaG (beta-lactamase superfamily)
MKLTKYAHSCFTVEKDGKVLVVDPGEYTTDFVAPENVVAIVVTHAHADHFDKELIAEIVDKNPGTVIIGPEEVTDQIEVFETRSVTGGDSVTVDPFDLEFFGGDHAVIYPSQPVAQNVGVLVNELLYYPGDSFTIPDKPVDTLSLPVVAPWSKLSEVVDFVQALGPRFAFPTHDAIASDIGKALYDRVMRQFLPDITYQRIDGKTIDV